jgi:hypothetical protein
MKVPNFLQKSGIKRVVGVDFESYYAQDYTLSGSKGLSTSEYVRDARFKAHGVGIGNKWVTHKDLKKAFAKIDWSTTAFLAHHAHFDGLILTHHFKHKPAFWLDTLSMARVWIDHSVRNDLDSVASYYDLGNKLPDVLNKCKGIRDLPPDLEKQLAAYCLQDVNLMSQIFEIMYFEEGFPDDELKLIDITVRMFCEPVLQVDIPRAEEELARVIKHNAIVIKNATAHLHLPRNLTPPERAERAKKVLNSDIQLAKVLVDLGVDVPYKVTPAGNRKPAFAKTDLAFHELQQHPDKRVRNICEARIITKSSIDESRAAKLILHAKPALPIYLNYGKAHTLRWTGGDKLNPQNFRRGGELRKCLIAPRGQQLIVVDSGQIEARVVAWLAGQMDVLEAFANPKRDLYCEFATQLFKQQVTKKEKQRRFVGKVAVLGLGFQMGGPKYQYTLASGVMGMKVDLDLQTCIDGVNLFRRTRPKIVAFWNYMRDRLVNMEKEDCDVELKAGIRFVYEGVQVPCGLTLQYPYLEVVRDVMDGRVIKTTYWNGKADVKIYGGLFTENLTQCIARIIVANQMREIAERYRIVLMTHDEVVYLAPTRRAQAALDEGLEALSTSKDWYSDIPLAAEGGYAREYSK